MGDKGLAAESVDQREEAWPVPGIINTITSEPAADYKA